MPATMEVMTMGKRNEHRMLFIELPKMNEAELENNIKRERIENVIAAVLAIPMVVFLVWAYLIATPLQLSAQADLDIEQEERMVEQ